MRVFRQFNKPLEVEEKRIIPIMESLKRDFAEDSAKISELAKLEDPQKFAESLLRNGSYVIGGFTVTLDHFRIHSSTRKETGKKIIPHVVEPSFGADRLVYASMEHAYSVRKDRVILRLPKDIAPFQAVVLPLLTKDDLISEAAEVHRDLVDSGLEAYYDEVGSIGRRYARSDEIGVPYAVTVDHQTLIDGTVTVRDRDTWEQTRVNKRELTSLIRKTTARNQTEG